jgi:hypothetical protein
MFDLVEAAKTLVNFCDDGDLMSALSYFEGEVRPEITEIETHEHAEILACMKTALLAIDDEDWSVALEAVDKMSAVLNG